MNEAQTRSLAAEAEDHPAAEGRLQGRESAGAAHYGRDADGDDLDYTQQADSQKAGHVMPGKRFSAKEDRQARHVAASERARGMSAKEAKSVGYATVVKQGAGKKKKTKRK